jgi:mannose-6-phosphate isomerase
VTQILPLSPARLEPIFVPRIWGMKSLVPLFPEKQNLHEPIGEVWLSGNESRFATGPYAGRALVDAWKAMPPEWAGTEMNTREAFPILAKFLFPGDKLSVQVHPDDEYARKNEAAAGGVGKTEAWYIVAAQPGAAVYVGPKPGVTRESFRNAIDAGTTMDCLLTIPVEQGVTVFVPAGTAHTIGPGMVICEIQENSDLTYRVYDYGRLSADGSMRPLHVEKALEVMNFGIQQSAVKRPPPTLPAGDTTGHIVACRYFAFENWDFTNAAQLTTEHSHFELWIILSGKGKIRWGSGENPGANSSDFGPGQIWFIPAALDSWTIDPETPANILRVYPPNLDLYAEQLKSYGLSIEEVAGIIRR